jgi:putative glutathione S-transferase
MAHTLFELEGIMPLTLAGPWLGGPDGWTFRSDQGSPVPDATKLWQVYATSDPSYTGRITVPVLWDIDAKAIASAESGEILACFIKAFSGKRGRMTVISAAEHRELAALCAWIKDRVNLGVYRIGFSSDQASYDRAYDSLAEALACLEARLSGRRYVWGNGLSEADLLLFATAVRFDTAYHGAFQILGLRWHDHPNLHAHLQRMLMLHAIERTVSTADYRVHYFDDAAFSIRHPGPDGRYIVPRTAKLM